MSIIYCKDDVLEIKRLGFWSGYKGETTSRCPYSDKNLYPAQVWINSYIKGKQARLIEALGDCFLNKVD